MKKLFSVLAVLGMFFFVGCNNSQTEEEESEEAVAIEQAVEKAVEESLNEETLSADEEPVNEESPESTDVQ